MSTRFDSAPPEPVAGIPMTLGAGASGTAGAGLTAGTAPPFTMRGVSAGLAGAADLLAGDAEFAGGVEVRAVGTLTSAAVSPSTEVVVGSASIAAGGVAGRELVAAAAGFSRGGWALLGVAVD